LTVIMKCLHPLIFCFSVSLMGMGNSFGNSNPYQIDDVLDQTLKAALHELYSLNFDKARAIYDSVQDHAAEHPMVAFGSAAVAWWKLSVDVLENDAAESREFLKESERCILLSKTKIKSGDPTGEAHVALGSMYALNARWEAANKHWLAVYSREKKTKKYLKKALEINPNVADANMALGIIDYTLSTLPRSVRFITASPVGKNPLKGLQELGIAGEKGTYLRLPAIFLLASIYSEDLKQPAKTVEQMNQLRLEISSSPFIDFVIFTAHYNKGDLNYLSAEADNYESRVKAGIYRTEFTSQGYFFKGLVKFKSKEWSEAGQYFDQAIQSAGDKNPFKIWATLYKGYASDASGKRMEALDCYKIVLNERPRWKSCEYAKARIKTPFTPHDPELTTLLL